MSEQRNEREELQELLSQVDPETVGLAFEYDIGEQATEFINSDLGRYIIGCARQDLQDAHRKLAKTLPFRWRRIQQLQNEIAMAEKFILYLRDLVIRGKAAELSLEERDETL
jgi:hypothetical protein